MRIKAAFLTLITGLSVVLTMTPVFAFEFHSGNASEHSDEHSEGFAHGEGGFGHSSFESSSHSESHSSYHSSEVGFSFDEGALVYGLVSALASPRPNYRDADDEYYNDDCHVVRLRLNDVPCRVDEETGQKQCLYQYKHVCD